MESIGDFLEDVSLFLKGLLISLRSSWLGIQRGKIILQQPVGKNIAAADPAQQNALGSIIQEARIASGAGFGSPEQEPQHAVLDTSDPPIQHPDSQASAQPSNQPDPQPANQINLQRDLVEQPVAQPEDQPGAQRDDQPNDQPNPPTIPGRTPDALIRLSIGPPD